MMNRIPLLVAIGFVYAAAFLPPGMAQKDNNATKQLKTLLDEVWDFEIQESPYLATDIGDQRGQDRLADDSLSGIERRTQARRVFLKRLKSIPVDLLSNLKQVDYELLKMRLEAQLADHSFQLHLMPINNREGFHISFPELPRLMNPKTVAEFKNYVARLNDFGRYTDEQIILMRGGIDAGLTQPAIIMRDSVKQAEAHIVGDPNESLLMKEISDDVRDKLGEDWTTVSADIRKAISTSVVPAYQRFADFLRKEYLPACRGPIGASARTSFRKPHERLP